MPFKNPEQQSETLVAESQAPDTEQSLETGDIRVAPNLASALPEKDELRAYCNRVQPFMDKWCGRLARIMQ